MTALPFSENFHTLSKKRVEALNSTDAMSRELRQCVHEFGYPIVKMFLDMGISSPAKIRQIIKEIWNGQRQAVQNTGTVNAVDVLLAQGVVSWSGLIRFLADNNLVIVPTSPTREMIDASMGALSDHTIRCTKEEKHKRRLIAALKASPYRPK